MNKIETLKKYTIDKFEKEKNKDNLKLVKNFFLDAIIPVIENYGDFLEQKNIDHAFQTQYAIKLLDDEDLGDYFLSLQAFDKQGNKVFNKNGKVVLRYPIDEFSYATLDHYDKIIEEVASDFFNGTQIENANADAIKFNQDIKDNMVLLLRHELTHAMCNTQGDTMKMNILKYLPTKDKLNFLKGFNFLRPSRFYMFDGGIFVGDAGLCDRIVDSQDYNIQDNQCIVEGITEYISYNIQAPVKALKGFRNFGNDIVFPSYTPYVWLVGCVNTIYDNVLIKSYYGGFEYAKDNLKTIKKALSICSGIVPIVHNLETINDELEYLYNLVDGSSAEDYIDALQEYGLSKERIEHKVAQKRVELQKQYDDDELFDLFMASDLSKCTKIGEIIELYAINLIMKDAIWQEIDCCENKIANYSNLLSQSLSKSTKQLVSCYNDELFKGNISPKMQAEFNKCFSNYLNYEDTWNSYLDLNALSSKYGFNEDEIVDILQDLKSKYLSQDNDLENNEIIK